jgi:DNA-binding beta-propeller fold protein YncE
MNLKLDLKLLALGTVVLLSGCATDRQPAVTNFTFFPPAPDVPRLQFLTSFSSDIDLGRKSGFADFVTGKPEAEKILIKPYGLALRGGKLYVCDTVANAIQIFDLVRKRATIFAPPGEGRLRMPINLTFDTDGTMYVADTGRNQVVIYGPDGTYRGAIGLRDQMRPCDVAVTADRLYIADLKSHAVLVYSKAERKELFTIPRDPKSEAPGKLFSPTNLAVDERGRVLVSDIGASAVQVYDLEGKHERAIGRQGVGAGMFARPKGVAVDRTGIAYVVDAATQVVQMFDPEGRLLLTFGAPGTTTYGELVLPAAVEVDYDNLSYFQKYVSPGRQLEYVILVTSQFGTRKVNVYGFLKPK